ncbi:MULTISPECIES: Rv3235 family protein [Nocardia]|uniref:Rv3235 family protein n=1 Tax=Nocardia TaxID=1817 RepID=UPI001C4E6773|nr:MULTISPECIES: Rv3235 family protein [Nocardia]
MSTDRLSLSRAPHCEPGLADQRADAGVPHRVSVPRRRDAGGAPYGVRRAVRASCVQGARSRAESDTGAARFAEQVVRLVLEVVDRRRPVDHLRSMTDPLVLSAVRTMLTQNLAPGRALGAASLTRVRVTATDPGGAEIFASYQRGDRTFAVAGRIESTRDRWRLVALRLF